MSGQHVCSCLAMRRKGKVSVVMETNHFSFSPSRRKSCTNLTGWTEPADRNPLMKERTQSERGYIILVACYANIMRISCVSVPEYVITELSWYVVLHFLSFNSLLHSDHLSRAVREAARKHIEQSILHMKALILAPVQQQNQH